MCEILCVHKNIFLALGSREQTSEACASWHNLRLVSPGKQMVGTTTRFGPMHIERIHEFCNRLGNSSESIDDQDAIAVVYTGSTNLCTVTESVVLVGSFLITWRGLSIQTVVEAFQQLNDLLGSDINLSSIWDAQCSLTVLDYWSALDHAVSIHWFVPCSSEDEPVLDVDEFAHYASAANGEVHMVVPGKLFCFPSPDCSIPDGHAWADEATPAGVTQRRFSPDYYAALFPDLGVTAVACLRHSPPAETATWAASRLGAADRLLHVPRTGTDAGALLVALERLLTLARATPGAIAVHSGAGFEWPAAAGTLVAAFLIRRFGFRAAAAAAWLRMLAPWMVCRATEAAADGTGGVADSRPT